MKHCMLVCVRVYRCVCVAEIGYFRSFPAEGEYSRHVHRDLPQSGGDFLFFTFPKRDNPRRSPLKRQKIAIYYSDAMIMEYVCVYVQVWLSDFVCEQEWFNMLWNHVEMRCECRALEENDFCRIQPCFFFKLCKSLKKSYMIVRTPVFPFFLQNQ